jgi:hypothetical protein
MCFAVGVIMSSAFSARPCTMTMKMPFPSPQAPLLLIQKKNPNFRNFVTVSRKSRCSAVRQIDKPSDPILYGLKVADAAAESAANYMLIPEIRSTTPVIPGQIIETCSKYRSQVDIDVVLESTPLSSYCNHALCPTWDSPGVHMELREEASWNGCCTSF